MKIIILIICLLGFSNAAAGYADELAPVKALRDLCQQLSIGMANPPIPFSMFGMSSAYVMLNLDLAVQAFLQRLHRTAAPFTQFTRIGNQIFYSGVLRQMNFQAVVDIASTNRTQVLLSATVFDFARVGSAREETKFLPPKIRTLQLLPAGGRLLMDVCYVDADRSCHQVYLFAHRHTQQLAAQLKAELVAANWRPQNARDGLVTWARYGRTIRYFLQDTSGGAALYLIAPGVLW